MADKKMIMDEEQRVYIRANMLLLKSAYLCAKEMPSKFFNGCEIRKMYLEDFFTMLGTNSKDYIKLVYGRLYPRDPMLEHLNGAGEIEKAVKGSQLLKVGKFDSVEAWKKVQEVWDKANWAANEKDKNGRDDKVEREMRKKVQKEINAAILAYYNNMSKMKTSKDFTYLTLRWLLGQIYDYAQSMNNVKDKVVEKKAKEFTTLTFGELDSCKTDTIIRLYKEVAPVWEALRSIYEYKYKKRYGSRGKGSPK